jgi:hypothetical protein
VEKVFRYTIYPDKILLFVENIDFIICFFRSFTAIFDGKRYKLINFAPK